MKMDELTVGEITTEFREVVELRTGHGDLFSGDGIEAAVFIWLKSVPNGEDDDSEDMVEELYCIPADVAAKMYQVLKFVMVHPSIIETIGGGVGGG